MKPERGEDEELELSDEEQAELWREWAEKGPQGPIPDEDADQAAVAELLGLSKGQFLDLLNPRNLPYLNADMRDLEREAAAKPFPS